MSRFQPALLGGLFIGVLSALPVVNWANACCCAWVVAGGVLTSYLLLQQARPVPTESAEIALQGLLAGFIGGLIYMGLTALVLSGAMGGQVVDQVRDALEQNPELPPEMRDRFVALAEGGGLVFIAGVVTIPTFAVFGMLGAFLGFSIFRKKSTPAPGGGMTS
jgi:hypothetical protein